MAPEVLCKQVHSYEVDYYAIGIIAYELMMGKVNLFLHRDHIQESIDNRSETQFYQNNISSRKTKFQMAGVLKQQTLLINLS